MVTRLLLTVGAVLSLATSSVLAEDAWFIFAVRYGDHVREIVGTSKLIEWDVDARYPQFIRVQNRVYLNEQKLPLPWKDVFRRESSVIYIKTDNLVSVTPIESPYQAAEAGASYHDWPQ